MAPPPLRELQQRLRDLIADPATASADDAVLDARVAHLGIAGDARLSAAARVRIYAEMYFVRLRDALAHDYAALARALGADAFDALARRYLAAHPSDRPSLRDLGRHLPGFARHEPDPLPVWQAELAQLEWAMIEAFDATDQPTLDEARLRALQPEQWPTLVVEPVASLALLACTTPADAVRERLLAGEPAGEVTAEAVLLRIWRQERTVYVRRVPVREMAALRWMHRGCLFEDLCGWLGTTVAPGEDPAAAALDLLGRWVEDGLLVAR
jgi:hypothetical protein